MSATSSGRNRTGKKRILVFCDYFLPSTKGGGGTWTVVNLIERLSDRFDFFVITRNHESRTDARPFRSVVTNAWNDVGNARVLYLAQTDIKIRRLKALIQEVSPAGVYLNSVFSKPVLTFLLFRRIRRYYGVPVIIAPCGELSIGALSLKWAKKNLFLKIAKVAGLYSKLNWKASTESESREIREVFGAGLTPFICPDLPPKQILADLDLSDKPLKISGDAKFIFYSRIDRKKNLLFALELLGKADVRGRIELVIVGPIQDEQYWYECRHEIDKLPSTISVRNVNAVSYETGLKYLTANHFFILPTLGENFGYAILEALSAGCPVLLSDGTIWSEVNNKSAGWAIPLDDLPQWEASINQSISMYQDEFSAMSRNARQVALDWLQSSDPEVAMERILTEVFGG